MQNLQIKPGGALQGEINVPGDKSITHRAIMIGAISRPGKIIIQNWLQSLDCLATLQAMRAMGIEINVHANNLQLTSVGLHGLQDPQKPINVGNSGTTIRLLTGILSAQKFSSTITGDASIRRRPMRRIIIPLTKMGASIIPASAAVVHEKHVIPAGAAVVHEKHVIAAGAAVVHEKHVDAAGAAVVHEKHVDAAGAAVVHEKHLIAAGAAVVHEKHVDAAGAAVVHEKHVDAAGAAVVHEKHVIAAGAAVVHEKHVDAAGAAVVYEKHVIPAKAALRRSCRDPHSPAVTDAFAPLHITGGQKLRSIDYAMPMASAQVKSAILLADLYATGTSRISAPNICRDHTEIMLQYFSQQNSADILIDIPGDLSAAAFFIVGATITPGADIFLRNIGINPTRAAIIEILRQMGADITCENIRKQNGEERADLRVRYVKKLRAIIVPQALVANAIDEIPILCLAAACADGTTVIRGAVELRFKESDRIAMLAQGFQRLGITVNEFSDGLALTGGVISGGTVDSGGDHRIAMTFAMAGLVAQQPIMVQDTAQIATSFPGFVRVAQNAGMLIGENLLCPI